MNSPTSIFWRAGPKAAVHSRGLKSRLGARSRGLTRLQEERPEFRDLTLYYFGDTDPAYYGVAGRCHVINAVDDQTCLPGLNRVETSYVGVSASLQFGPWGPPCFFRELNRVKPVRLTDDTTIAIYRTAELRSDQASLNKCPARATGDLQARRPARRHALPASGHRSTRWRRQSHSRSRRSILRLAERGPRSVRRRCGR